MDLDLATNKELIDELLDRKNFCGAVIFSMDEHRVKNQEHCEFGMGSTLCDKESTIRLLKSMTEDLNNTE